MGLLGGCASLTPPMKANESATLQQAQRIYATTENGWSLSVTTPRDAFIGLLAIADENAEGKDMMQKDELSDPAVTVEQQLVAGLMHRGTVSNIVFDPHPIPNRSVLPARYGHTGLALTVFDVASMLAYLPDPILPRYHLMYRAGVRLVRLSDGKVLWTGMCALQREPAAHPPSFDEVEAHHGAWLKNALTKAADGCAQQLLTLFPSGKSATTVHEAAR